MKDIITKYLKDDFNESCLRYCSLTIRNKLKIETTHFLSVFESLKFSQHEDDTVKGEVSEVKTRRTARSERSGLNVHEHREYGTTQYSQRATNRTDETPSGCEVKRLSVHGGCPGSQRR